MSRAIALVFIVGLSLVGLALNLEKELRLEDGTLSASLVTLGGALIVGDVLFVIGFAIYQVCNA